MGRFARCLADEVGIYAGDQSRRIGAGALVDLDDVVIPANGSTPAETLRDVLGHRIDAFEIAESATTAIEALEVFARRDAAALGASMTASDATEATPAESSPAEPDAPLETTSIEDDAAASRRI